MSKREPQQERAQRTYNRILDSVEDIILKKTVHKLTPRAVVLATGIPQGTLYRYFSDVIEMRDALFERYMARFVIQVSAMLVTADIPDAVSAMVLVFDLILRYNRANPVLLTLSLDPTTHSRRRAVEHQRELIATRIAETLLSKGLIRSYDKAMLDEIYLCVLVSASLTKEAFVRDPAGETFAIEAGRRIIRRQAEGFLEDSSAQVEEVAQPTAATPARKKAITRSGLHSRRVRVQ
jgi:AcrR family transcriptional regulator